MQNGRKFLVCRPLTFCKAFLHVQYIHIIINSMDCLKYVNYNLRYDTNLLIYKYVFKFYSIKILTYIAVNNKCPTACNLKSK